MFAGFGSVDAVVTVTVLVIEGAAAAPGITTITTVSVAPACRVPMLEVTVPPEFVTAEPSVEVPEPKRHVRRQHVGEHHAGRVVGAVVA